MAGLLGPEWLMRSMVPYDRIFLLGLDGLDHDLVIEWGLNNLKQKECGKIEVPINEKIGAPTSPEVWASFLTGKRVTKDFVKKFPLGMVLQIIKIMREHINVSMGLWKRIGKIAPSRFPKLTQDTFLDYINSKLINAPYYNYDNKGLDIVYKFGKRRISLKQTINQLDNLYEHRKKQILYEVENFDNFDVCFAYMHFPDLLQHLLFLSPHILKEHYVNLDNFTRLLQLKLDQTTLLIIVSDHGLNLENGNHSKNGFYSSNFILTKKITRITDFASLTQELKSIKQ